MFLTISHCLDFHRISDISFSISPSKALSFGRPGSVVSCDSRSTGDLCLNEWIGFCFFCTGLVGLEFVNALWLEGVIFMWEIFIFISFKSSVNLNIFVNLKTFVYN